MPPFPPPKRSVECVAESYAMAEEDRAEGLDGSEGLTHSRPRRNQQIGKRSELESRSTVRRRGVSRLALTFIPFALN
jgi:hypothetical protein